MALEQLKLMVMQAGLGMSPGEIFNYIKNVIDIVVQLKRGTHGKRFVSEIYFRAYEERKAHHLTEERRHEEIIPNQTVNKNGQ